MLEKAEAGRHIRSYPPLHGKLEASLGYMKFVSKLLKRRVGREKIKTEMQLIFYKIPKFSMTLALQY